MYLDPGFGSMLIQVIIALIAGAGAYLVIIRKRLFSFFRSKNQLHKHKASEVSDISQVKDDSI